MQFLQLQEKERHTVWYKDPQVFESKVIKQWGNQHIINFILTITHLMPMEGYAIHFNTSLAHNVLHHEYLGIDENHDDVKTFHTVLVQLIRFSHKDTHIYTTDKFSYDNNMVQWFFTVH